MFSPYNFNIKYLNYEMTKLSSFLTYLTESVNGVRAEGPKACDNVNHRDVFHNYFDLGTHSAIFSKPQGPIM